MDVHGTKKQIFKAEIAYTPHDLFRPHPLDSRFQHCNILGVDWLRMNEVHLNLRFPGPMMLTIPPIGFSVSKNYMSAVEE